MSENFDEQYFDTVFFNVIEFLTEYEQLPCLWDRDHLRFKDRRYRIKLEESLGEKLGITDLKVLRKKIRSVRGTYNTEIRKIKSSIENGVEVYKPKLSWFPIADRFLRVTTDLPYELFPLMDFDGILSSEPKQRLQQKSPRSKLLIVPLSNKRRKLVDMVDIDHEKEQNNDETYEEYEELEFTDHEEINDKNDNSNMKQEILEEYETDTEQIDNMTNVFQTRKPTNNSELSDIVRYLKGLASASENEFAAFGRSIGIQLQNLPLELAVQLQTDIQAHITKSRLDYLKRTKKQSNESD